MAVAKVRLGIKTRKKIKIEIGQPVDGGSAESLAFFPKSLLTYEGQKKSELSDDETAGEVGERSS